MWMMGYNEGASDSVNGGRKLRPLIPRLSSCPTTANTNSDHRFNMVMTAEQKMKELMMFNSEPQHPPVTVSSRWNPTPDQLMVLEELYRQGTRTPSADHIQQITSQLRRYGMIEGKNVFYWFQNHKARERQKRRRLQMETGHQDSFITTPTLVSNHGLDKIVPPGYKVEQAKNWICSVGCATQPEKPHDHHHQEEPVSKTMVATKHNGRHGEYERESFRWRNSTWHTTQLPPALYSSSQHHHHHRLTLNSASVSPNMSTSNMKDMVTASHLLLGTRKATNTETCDGNKQHEECSKGESDHEEQTLELFPLRKEGFCNNDGGEEQEKESANYCFYEFLPLKI